MVPSMILELLFSVLTFFKKLCSSVSNELLEDLSATKTKNILITAKTDCIIVPKANEKS